MLLSMHFQSVYAQGKVTRQKKAKIETQVRHTNKTIKQKTIDNNTAERHESMQQDTVIKSTPVDPNPTKHEGLWVEDFKRLDNDLAATLTETMKKDVNGRTSALIKIYTDLDEAQTVFDNGVMEIVARVNKPGEVWLYIPARSQSILIQYKNYPPLRYFFPEEIQAGKTYSMRLMVEDLAESITSEQESNQTSVDKPLTGIINGHEWVDLGLPSGLKWATCNVGATRPEEYGDYFAWGEPKSRTQGFTCVSKNTDVPKLEQKGIINEMKRLSPSNDAATFSWKSSWRMPTIEDFNELLINCRCATKTYQGVRGIEFTGPNGKTIFLPRAGRFDGKEKEYDVYYYWTSTPVGKYSAYCGFDRKDMGQPIGNDGHCSLTEYNREYFQSIRPVTE